MCDPELTLGLPSALTAATGFDALAHAIECYTNNACQPISAALALEAIRLIGANLRSAASDGRDRPSRYAMMLASTMAGMAMNPTRLGLAHALAMPLGSWDLKIPHSMAIAVMLPVVMGFNCTAAPERFVAVARALGEPVDGYSTLEGAARAALSVRQLPGTSGSERTFPIWSRGAPRPRGRRGSDEERKRRGQSAAHDQGAARRHPAMCAAEFVTAPLQERSIEGPVTNRITRTCRST